MTSANFLVDSESQLQGAESMMGMMGADRHGRPEDGEREADVDGRGANERRDEGNEPAPDDTERLRAEREASAI